MTSTYYARLRKLLPPRTLMVGCVGLLVVSAQATLSDSGGAGREAPVCPGDCDGNGTVTIDELVTGIAIASGLQPLTACAAADVDGDGNVTIDELALAVRTALLGCSTSDDRLLVLVSNDDGVLAAGISAVAQALEGNPSLRVVVVAPATNQSGSGDSTSTDPVDVAAAVTADGHPATAVAGFPADSVLFAVLEEMPTAPDIVVAGINSGQNISDFVDVSGTVGAAVTAARLGIPAIATSQGFVATDYEDQAVFVAQLVERFRTDAGFRELMTRPEEGTPLVLNVNFPTCAEGIRRGLKVVPIGPVARVIGYELIGEENGLRTYQPIRETRNAFASDCTSTLENPIDDVEAMTNGFASVTPLNTDLTAVGSLDEFLFLEE